MSGGKNLIYLLFLGFALCILLPGKSQDIHFSQFINAPLHLNPAETGMFNGDIRFVANHKRQWKAFEDAYSTIAASADMTLLKDKKIKPSVGLLLANDVAGDGDFGTFRTEIPIAANFQYEKATFSLGISPAIVQHGLNFNALYFGSQYDGDQFDPSLPNYEIPDVERFNYFDLSSGILTSYRINDSASFVLGASVNHLLAPQKSFYTNPLVVLDLRWQIYATGSMQIAEDIFAMPAFLFMKQGVYREINFGSNFRFDFNPLGLRSMFVGAYLRTKDAGILMFGMDYNKTCFQISYDINFSGLRTISRGRGGVELSLVYIFQKTRILTSPPVRKCPDFI
ncbi:MAG: PorP/SprF family type IX secretion system membrane protein [Bacteroidota bacterium]|nr:PorP/SprF family type IX secretion system membrane protein [Bacteroidota bacterium]